MKIGYAYPCGSRGPEPSNPYGFTRWGAAPVTIAQHAIEAQKSLPDDAEFHVVLHRPYGEHPDGGDMDLDMAIHLREDLSWCHIIAEVDEAVRMMDAAGIPVSLYLGTIENNLEALRLAGRFTALQDRLERSVADVMALPCGLILDASANAKYPDDSLYSRWASEVGRAKRDQGHGFSVEPLPGYGNSWSLAHPGFCLLRHWIDEHSHVFRHNASVWISNHKEGRKWWQAQSDPLKAWAEQVKQYELTTLLHPDSDWQPSLVELAEALRA
jgi:hypothetical protein